MNNNFKIKKGLNVEPTTGSTVTTKGDVAYNSSSDQLEVFGASAAESLTTTTNTQTLTNKTLTTPVISTITNTGTLTLPTSTDTLVGRATTDTLTNKTLTAPIISTISNTGTITLPTSTDTLVGRDTTDTLTNKTISGASNTISNVSLTSSVTGTLPIANGGTSATTKAGAFDALSPMTTAGDLIYGGAAGTNTRLPGGADNQVLKYVSGVPTWSTFSNNGINYISSNPDAETGVSGWATYLDAAGVSPVDGTGGVSTLTFARTTSSPLRGTGSFLITQPNSTSVQGNGVSFDFTIDSADKAKPLVVSFDYNASTDFTASSGQTGSESDVEVYLYDVTNTVLIPISPKVLTAKGANNFEFKGEFQTSSNSSSYRLILHCATTNAPATGFQLKFDNVFVGPQANVQGAPVTDFTPYTPTIVGAGTPTGVEFQYRRNGGNLEIQGYFVAGTVTGTTASISLPPGLVIDSSILGSSVYNLCGLMTSVTYTNAQYPIMRGGDSTLGVSAAASGAGALSPQNGNAFWNTGQAVSLTASVPIAGWASTVQLSQDTDTRVVAAKAGILTPASASATVPVNFDLIYHDTHSAISIVSGVWSYKVPVSGIYSIGISVANNQANAASTYDAYLNGVLNTSLTEANTDAHRNTSGSCDIKCVAGDILDIRPNTTVTPSATSVINGSVVSIHRLSGPATIAASETVAASYTTSAGQSIPSGVETVIDFENKSIDTHGTVTTGAGWNFKCPSAGKYSISAQISMGAGAVSYCQLHMRLNGLDVIISSILVNGSFAQTVSVKKTLNLIPGDIIDFRVAQGSGGAIALTGADTYNSVDIYRV